MKARLPDVLVFCTGAVTLSLEVLASRVMTPYFGVSLYIWASILAMTLIFLAAGYRLGGRLAGGEHTAMLFVMAPPVSAAAIAVSCLVFPVLFPVLASTSLIGGTFVASAALLAVPLVVLSAMNPLLIALAGRTGDGDGGAGRVFFVSTVGSVAGVLLTAFVLIPALADFQAMALLACLLSLCSAGVALQMGVRRAAVAGLVAAVLSAGCMAMYRPYLDRLGQGHDVSVTAEYRSHFGTIKVVRFNGQLAFVQDGLLQNRADTNLQSLSPYTYTLELLAVGFAPQARQALVLGLGAGFVPAGLAAAGLDTTVVEINPDALTVARTHFGFPADSVTTRIEDARTSVRSCERQFDVAVVDLFSRDITPDYLMSQEFFVDLARCLRHDGVMVMNVLFDTTDDAPNRAVLATVASAFEHVALFERASEASVASTFVVASAATLQPSRQTSLDRVPVAIRRGVARMLTGGKPLDPARIDGVAPVSDAHNRFAVLYAPTQMRYRQRLLEVWPSVLLVN